MLERLCRRFGSSTFAGACPLSIPCPQEYIIPTRPIVSLVQRLQQARQLDKKLLVWMEVGWITPSCLRTTANDPQNDCQ